MRNARKIKLRDIYFPGLVIAKVSMFFKEIQFLDYLAFVNEHLFRARSEVIPMPTAKNYLLQYRSIYIGHIFETTF